MFKKLIIIGFCTLFLSSVGAAVKLQNLIINGNERVSDETIKIYGNIKINEIIDEAEINNILKRLYETNFFEDVKIKLENNTLRLELKEYPVINQLLIVGEPSQKVKDELKKILSLKDKNSFIKSNLSKDIDLIKNFYSSMGYNFSAVDAKFNKVDERNIDLIFEINKGEQTKISSITFIGDKKIKSKRLLDVIASEKDQFWKFLSRNTKFSKNLLNLDKRLLNNYYKSLGYYDVKITSNSAELNESGDIDLIYSIDAGTRYTVNKISTNLDPTFDKKIFFELEKDFKKYVGEYYSPFKIQKLIDKLDRLIEKNNIQFVEYNIEEEIVGENISRDSISGFKLIIEAQVATKFILSATISVLLFSSKYLTE